MDMTSLGRTAPLPYDADALAQASGVTTEAFIAAFLQGRTEPEDLWAVLFSLASGDPDDRGAPQPLSLSAGWAAP